MFEFIKTRNNFGLPRRIPIKSRIFNEELSELYIRSNLIVIHFLSLAENRQQLSQKLFKQIMSTSSDRLSYLIPETRFHKHGRKLRHSENLDVFKCS